MLIMKKYHFKNDSLFILQFTFDSLFLRGHVTCVAVIRIGNLSTDDGDARDDA